MEIYKLPQGKIIIIHSDRNLSQGLLILEPHKQLVKHNRPVNEELIQIQGRCEMILFKKDKEVKRVSLKEKQKLFIPANRFHIHSNPTDEISITQWKFRGDISETINHIRKSYPTIFS